MNFNKVILVGRVTQDPQVRTTPSGTMVANFSIATTRVWRDQSNNQQEKTDFHNIVVWQRQAELIEQYVHKGSLIMIEGRLETRSWDAQDGSKRYRTEVIANVIQFGPRSASQQGSPPPTNTPATTDNKATPSTPKNNTDDIPTVDIDDINIDDTPF